MQRVTRPQGQRYEIVVRGRLAARFGAAFDGLVREPRRGATALTGDFADPAQLHSVLDRLSDIGLEVVSVHAVD
jgi:hypothetical protein